MLTIFLILLSQIYFISCATIDFSPIFGSSGLNDWTIGGDHLYWAMYCEGGTEFFWPGYIRSAWLSFLPYSTNYNELLTLPSTCSGSDNVNQITAQDSALYYSSFNNRIWNLNVYTTVKTLLSTQVTDVETLYDVVDGFIYYETKGEIAIARASVSGTGTEEKFITDTFPRALAFDQTGKVMFWIDSSGINSKPYNGALSASKKVQISAASAGSGLGNKLLVFRKSGTLYLIFTNLGTQIRRSSCTYSLFIGSWTCTTPTTIITSDTNWKIDTLSFSSDGKLFWSESLYDPTSEFNFLPVGGRIRRINDLTAASNLPVTIDQKGTDKMIVVEPYLYVTGRRLDLTTPAIPAFDLRFSAWEVTQVIQNLNNNVPLVKGKPTFVRVYPKLLSGPNAPYVTATLEGRRNGVLLGTLDPINLYSKSLDTTFNFNRANLNDGYLFRLPASWNSGTIELTARIDPVNFYPNSVPSRKVKVQSFTFTETAPVCIVAIPVRTDGSTASYTSPVHQKSKASVKQLFPTADVWGYYQTDDVAELQFFSYGPYEIPEDNWKILLALATRDFFTDDPDECDNAGAVTHYVGLVSGDTNTNLDKGGFQTGEGYTPGSSLWYKLTDSVPPVTLAHELGHNYGREHVLCPAVNGPANPDMGYPYEDDCKLSWNDLTSAGTHFGFDAKKLEVKAPNANSDIMTYQHPKWMSAYTYTAILSEISLSKKRDIQLISQQDNDTYVYVSGVYNASDNTGLITQPYFASPLTSKLRSLLMLSYPTKENTSPIHITVYDKDNNLLGDWVPFLVSPSEDNLSLFQGVFLAPSRVIGKYALVAGSNKSISNFAVTSEISGLEINSPTAGNSFKDLPYNIQFTTRISSPENVQFSVYYSHNNGQTWQLVKSGIPTDGSNILSISTKGSKSPGSSLIKVQVNNGGYDLTKISSGFTVQNQAPNPIIESSTDGETLSPTVPVYISGSATDPEDGLLAGESYSWTIDQLSYPKQNSFIVDGLAPGNHTVTLTVTDSQKLTASTSSSFIISPLSLLVSPSPLLDGQCNEYASDNNAIHLTLKPYSDDTRARVSILRSSDSLWVCFHALKHLNASKVVVAVDGDASGNDNAQSDDLLYALNENGYVSIRSGNGAGGFDSPPPSTATFQSSASQLTSTLWSAEFKIPLSNLKQKLRLLFGHLPLSGSLRLFPRVTPYFYPYDALLTSPKTWASTVLN